MLFRSVWLIIAVNSCIAGVMATIVLSNVRLPVGRSLFVSLGLISYPLYLLHAHLGYVVIKRFADDTNGAWVVGICAISVIALSAALTYIWERPVQRRLRPLLAKFVVGRA